jgi:nicotinate-nucleotide adenylyltransferase
MMRHRLAAETRYDFPAGRERPVWPQTPPQIGLYAGSFDPVHAGHIIFALKAQKLAGLDQIYFIPERRPAHGGAPEHYVHRAVMLQRALKPHRQFAVLDLPDARLTATSLARARQQLGVGAEVSLLTTASELLWQDGLPDVYRRLRLIVAVTSHVQLAEVLSRLQFGKAHVQNITFVDVGSDNISSAAVRSGLRARRKVRGVLPSVWRYARRQWLYLPLNRE